nr:MAG TPA: hypothetical protein [Caudoviricetes sp.]
MGVSSPLVDAHGSVYHRSDYIPFHQGDVPTVVFGVSRCNLNIHLRWILRMYLKSTF